MMPKNPLDAILAEALGDDGGLLLAGTWPPDEPTHADDEPAEGPTPDDAPVILIEA